MYPLLIWQCTVPLFSCGTSTEIIYTRLQNGKGLEVSIVCLARFDLLPQGIPNSRYDNPKFLWISVQGRACRRSPNCWACGLSPVTNLKCAMAEQMGASCFSKSGATKVESKCVLFHPETNAFGYPNFEKHSNVILPK